MRKYILIAAILAFAIPASPQVNAVNHFTTGQQAVTATAAVITGLGAGSVCVKALAANSINVYLGNSSVTDSTGMELAPGNAYCAPQIYTSAPQLYVIASTTGASVSWIVSN